jgi:hypothetical protein
MPAKPANGANKKHIQALKNGVACTRRRFFSAIVAIHIISSPQPVQKKRPFTATTATHVASRFSFTLFIFNPELY